MNTIFYHPATADAALINPADTVQPVEHFPEAVSYTHLDVYKRQI